MGWDWPNATHIQDPLSLRMMSQVFATGFDTLVASGKILLAATGRTDDNPVVAGGQVLTSGGSLPLDVTIFLQTAQLGLAHIGAQFVQPLRAARQWRTPRPARQPGAAGPDRHRLRPDHQAGRRTLRARPDYVGPISANSMVVAGGIEDEAAFLPLVVERFERQVLALRRLSAA
jgi:histidine ammonia-lyase